MNALGQRLRGYWRIWHARPLRERVLVLAALAGLVLMVGDRVWTGPAWVLRRAAHAQAQQSAQALAELRANVQQQAQALAQQRQQQAAERSRLQQELDALRTHQAAPMSGEAALTLLETLVQRQQGRVQLVALTAVPGAAPSPASASASAAPPLYRHGLKLVVAGRYAALHDYLHALAQESGIRLGGFELAVREHPELELTVHIEMLSTQAAWVTL